MTDLVSALALGAAALDECSVDAMDGRRSRSVLDECSVDVWDLLRTRTGGVHGLDVRERIEPWIEEPSDWSVPRLASRACRWPIVRAPVSNSDTDFLA